MRQQKKENWQNFLVLIHWKPIIYSAVLLKVDFTQGFEFTEFAHFDICISCRSGNQLNRLIGNYIA